MKSCNRSHLIQEGPAKSIALALRGEAFRKGKQLSRESSNSSADQARLYDLLLRNLIKPMERRGHLVHLYAASYATGFSHASMLNHTFRHRFKGLWTMARNKSTQAKMALFALQRYSENRARDYDGVLLWRHDLEVHKKFEGIFKRSTFGIKRRQLRVPGWCGEKFILGGALGGAKDWSKRHWMVKNWITNDYVQWIPTPLLPCFTALLQIGWPCECIEPFEKYAGPFDDIVFPISIHRTPTLMI
jgi:hypothetical protein